MKAVTWIGVDIAKESFVAAQRDPEGFQTEQFPVSPKGLKAFGKWLPQELQLQIVLEATGPYWCAFIHELRRVAPEIPVAVVNPRRVRDFAKASSHTSKTDPLDAQVLLHFAETFEPRLMEPSGDRADRQLRALTRHALQITEQRDEVRNQQEKAAADPDHPQVRASLLAGTSQAPGTLPEAMLVSSPTVPRSGPPAEGIFSSAALDSRYWTEDRFDPHQ
jgi:transposase